MMHEIVKVTLDNEMDLILAHKRSMKLAEIAGLSLSAQTTFATAVSEVARNTIESGKSGSLVLQVEIDNRDRYIVACLKGKYALDEAREGLAFAKRLVSRYNVSSEEAETSVDLFYSISPLFRVDIQKLDEWRSMFRNEPPISPYDELKRKNEQLQQLSDKIQKSEAQYKTLTNSLPQIIFSIGADGEVLYANKWLTSYSGETVESINRSKWKSFLHTDDYPSFLLLLNTEIAKGVATIRIQARLRNMASRQDLWQHVGFPPFNNEGGEVQYWIGYMVDIHAQKNLEETLRDNVELKEAQEQLKEIQYSQEQYIRELNRSNLELQQFAFIASHDLQEPVRKLMYYSDTLINKYSASLEPKAVEHLNAMLHSAARMRVLIKDLLVFSQINSDSINFEPIDLNRIIENSKNNFEIIIAEKKAVINVGLLPLVHGDRSMIGQLFENIISNSLKYSKDDYPVEINITSLTEGSYAEIAVRDNGIGFDEKYLPQMFTLFQRLHDRVKYDGTGLGLAICKKIVDIHGGKIRATATEGEGATFYIRLPLERAREREREREKETETGTETETARERGAETITNK